jgi:hypothetical protein
MVLVSLRSSKSIKLCCDVLSDVLSIVLVSLYSLDMHGIPGQRVSFLAI